MFSDNSTKRTPFGNIAPKTTVSSPLAADGSGVFSATEKSGLRFTLTVAGLPPDTFAVVGFTLQERYSAPFSLVIYF